MKIPSANTMVSTMTATISSPSRSSRRGNMSRATAGNARMEINASLTERITNHPDAIKNLQVDTQKIYGANPTALRAAGKVINAFGDWVDACHNYRHEEGVEEPSQPPIDLAVSLISMGSSQLRWLISLDQASKSPST